MSQAVKSTLLWYADDSCILYQRTDADEIEKHLDKDFENICDWFVDNKLSIHFGIDFASKRRSKNIHQPNNWYNHINIKQGSQVTYIGCVLDERMSCEPMALKVINKIMGN